MSGYTVVVSSTGRTEYLIQLIESIEEQTVLPEAIHLLLDDNSDCSLCRTTLIRRFGESLLDISLLRGYNLPMKRNHGASISKSDVVMYSDDDDIWDKRKAELTLASIKAGYSVICHNYSCFGSYEAENCNRLGRQSRLLPRILLLAGDNIYGGGSTISGRRDVFMAICFDERLGSCEDYEWWRRVQLAGHSIYYIGNDLVAYRRHTSNMGRNRLRMSHTLVAVGIEGITLGMLLLMHGFAVVLKGIIRAAR